MSGRSANCGTSTRVRAHARLGLALESLGERERGTAHLDEAVAAYRLALQEQTHERVPLDWAATQANLGSALETLGERESGTTHLDEAVTADRLALEEMTRERVPLDWAQAQINLGNALEALGERESGTAHLDEAIKAYTAACRAYVTAKASDKSCRKKLARAQATMAKRKGVARR